MDNLLLKYSLCADPIYTICHGLVWISNTCAEDLGLLSIISHRHLCIFNAVMNDYLAFALFSAGQLELQLCFMNIRRGWKVIVILDMTNLNW